MNAERSLIGFNEAAFRGKPHSLASMRPRSDERGKTAIQLPSMSRVRMNAGETDVERRCFNEAAFG